MTAQVTDPESCFSCGGNFAKIEGPVHSYMASTPGCWAAYGQVLTREYENAVLFAASHRLTVDAYALQHPGYLKCRQALQSVWVHFTALYLALDERRPHAHIPAIMQRLTKRAFPIIERMPTCFAVTHRDVLDAPASQHIASVQRWANCAYEEWSHLREGAKSMLASL